MPVINVDYDDAVVSEKDVNDLSQALQKIVAEATNIDDVNVYANTAHIKVNILPIEVFIRMTAAKVENETALTENIEHRLREWKKEVSYPHKVNIYLIPMQWTVRSDI